MLGMKKVQYEKDRPISSMRTFEASKADMFIFQGKVKKRVDLERMVYGTLRAAMIGGSVYTAKKVE